MKLRFVLFLTLIWVTGLSGCSGLFIEEEEPMPVIPPEPPKLTAVPHPQGMDSGDLLAIFTEKNAPSPDSLKGCDADFKKLKSSTVSREEIAQGVKELITSDAVKWHWCFYGQLYQLDQTLKTETFIDAKQKALVETYQMLTPFSRAFMSEFRDSRYWRWAINRYQTYSARVFYRRVESSPATTAELVGIVNPYGTFRPAAAMPKSVLEKYGIAKPEANRDANVMAEGPALPTARSPASKASSALPAIDPAMAEQPTETAPTEAFDALGDEELPPPTR